MTHASFLFAVLALLAAPGPTNTLMALAGAQGGLSKAARLIPAEMLGYMTTILPLTYLGAATLDRWPAASALLKIVAAGWVLYLALRLWRAPGKARGIVHITARRVYVTTLLNPKALVVGLILIPAPMAGDFLSKLCLFFLTVPLIAAGWFGAGRMAGRTGSPARMLAIQRLASVCLTVLSGTLFVAAMRA